jgi:hypothetical protein
MKLLLALLAAALVASAQPLPFRDGEVLRYNVNWPSGLTLGEVQFTAKSAPGLAWNFEMVLEAALPAFPVEDRYRSQATSSLCSERFEKRFRHGKRKTDEDVFFDQMAHTVTRTTLPDGPKVGRSEQPAPDCARDALSFLYFVRRELSAGRIPSPQTIFYGAPYQIRFESGGVKPVEIGGARQDADRLVAFVKGPASQISFELFFARDAARTLLLARVPFAVGSFALELVR